MPVQIEPSINPYIKQPMYKTLINYLSNCKEKAWKKRLLTSDSTPKQIYLSKIRKRFNRRSKLTAEEALKVLKVLPTS